MYSCSSPIWFFLFSKQFFSTCESGIQYPWNICFYHSLGPPSTASVLYCCGSFNSHAFQENYYIVLTTFKEDGNEVELENAVLNGQYLSKNSSLRTWNMNNLEFTAARVTTYNCWDYLVNHQTHSYLNPFFKQNTTQWSSNTIFLLFLYW